MPFDRTDDQPPGLPDAERGAIGCAAGPPRYWRVTTPHVDAED
jgi:hypothetical protein